MLLMIEMDEEHYKTIVDNPVFHTNELEDIIAKGIPINVNLCDENKVIMGLVYGDLLKEDTKCGDVVRLMDSARVIKADKILFPVVDCITCGIPIGDTQCYSCFDHSLWIPKEE